MDQQLRPNKIKTLFSKFKEYFFFSSRQPDWKILEGQSPDEQERFFSDWEENFIIKDVSSRKQNVKKGDHLMVYRCGYTHHFLCTSVQRNRIKVMEYGGPWFDLSVNEVLALDVEKMAVVKEKEYSIEELEEKEVKKKAWPKMLRRFNANESVDRARSREGERNYNCLTNNCEHFVMWCKCGLKVSLQVQSWSKWVLREVVCSLLAGGKEYVAQEGCRQLVPVLLNVFTDHVSLVNIYIRQYVPFVTGATTNIGITYLSYYELKKALDQRKNGLILSDELFDAKIIEIVAKSIFRLGLEGAGLAFGGLYGGFCGSLALWFLGAIAGHLLGAPISWIMKKILWI